MSMLIDELRETLEEHKITKLSEEAPDADLMTLAAQVEKLDDLTPPFNIHNVYTWIRPEHIRNAQPGSPGEKRNADMREKRDELLSVAATAPVYAPYNIMWLEHRYSGTQRVGYLMTFVPEFMKWTVSLAFDSVRRINGIDIIVNAFEIELGDDEMFGNFRFKSSKEITENKENEEALTWAAEVARTCLQMLNWKDDDETTGTQVILQQVGKPTNRGNKNGKPHRKQSTPHLIRFEPFMKNRKTHAAATRTTMGEAALHIVRATRPIYKMTAPLGGTTDWRTGKKKKLVLGRNYGMLRRKQHLRGNPKLGKVRGGGTLVIGDIKNPNSNPAPTAPAPAQEDMKP